MNKRISVVAALILAACFIAFPVAGLCVSAEEGAADKAGTVIYSQDFESFPAADAATEENVFNDAKGNKPEGFNDFIGDGERSGALISANGVGGTKSMRLMRYDGGVADMRVTGLNIGAFGEGSEVDFTFSFRYKALGNYGFSVILAGIPESLTVEDYGGGTRNIFSSGTDDETGKDVLYVVNPEGGSIAAADFLKADTDYVVRTVFTLGSDEYKLYINGELIGTYKYIGKLTNITAFRIDCHDWAEENDISKSQKGSCHVNEVYFDDISLTVYGSGSPAEGNDKLYTFKGEDYYYLEDFEILFAGSDYEQPNKESPTFSYIEEMPFLSSSRTPFVNPASFVMPVDNDRDFDGVAVAVKDFLDMRFWMIPAADDPDADIFVYFSVKVKNLTGCFDMCVTNVSEGGTVTDSTDRGGMVIRLEPSKDGKVAILNSARQAVGTFEKDKFVTIGAAFFKDTNSYAIFLDGQMIEGGMSIYPEEFAGVAALRFDLDGNGGELVFDDIYIEYGELKEKAAGGEETAAPETSEPPATEEQPTAEPTDEPVVTEEPAAPTEAPSETDAPAEPTEQPSKKKGCGGTVASGTLLIVALAAVPFVMKKKK